MAPSNTQILSILESLGYGAAIVSADGSIQGMNKSADRDLPKMLRSFGFGSYPTRLPTKLVTLLDRSAPGPVFLSLTKIRAFVAQKCALETGATFLLLCVDLNTLRSAQADVLQRGFGLTRCESLVAAALSTGISLHQIARWHGVGIGTVRGQLKSVFIKTGTKRQPELVAMLARLVCFGSHEIPAPTLQQSLATNGSVIHSGARQIDAHHRPQLGS
jgi:DNA-binding CsgD family transcriptional regulator